MYLTPAQCASLRAELDGVLADLRAAEAAVIDAREQTGNQAENATAEVALDEQRRLVERAAHLADLLAAASDAPPPAGDRAEPGTRVQVAFPGGDTETYLFGSAAGTDEDVITPASPLGQALLGRAVGESVSFATPAGRTVSLSILAVEAA